MYVKLIELICCWGINLIDLLFRMAISLSTRINFQQCLSSSVKKVLDIFYLLMYYKL